MRYHSSRTLRDSDRQQLYRALDVFNIAAYFATADGKKELFGFGAQQETDVPEKLAGDIIFGGYAFDDQVIENSKLMNGIWFVPTIFVEIKQDKIYFESHSVNAFDNWIMQFKQATTKNMISRDLIGEIDWTTRTQKLIDVLATDEKLKKVVFGRQQQYALSEAVLISNLVQALSSQKNTYHVILKYQTELFISATPERLVKVSAGKLRTAAVAGTIRRGDTLIEDRLLGEMLLNSHKNQQEHQYVVNSIDQKLQGLTTNLQLPVHPILLQNKQVQHLYTPIVGDLIATYTVLDVVRKLHPTPALGGAPQEQALQYIKTHEKSPRGLFAAPIGYYTAHNSGEFVVGIRSMYVNQATHMATLFAGAGIVQDSNAAQEFKETDLKFEPMRQLLKRYANDN